MLDSLRKKLSSDSGETLVEILVAILITVLSVVLLLGATMAAANINKQANEFDTAFNEQQIAAESWSSAYSTSTSGVLTVYNSAGAKVGKSYTVTVYGSGAEDELVAYKWSGSLGS